MGHVSMGGGTRHVSTGEGMGHMSVGGDSTEGGKESGDANASSGRKWAPPAKGSTIRGTNVGGLGLSLLVWDTSSNMTVVVTCRLCVLCR